MKKAKFAATTIIAIAATMVLLPLSNVMAVPAKNTSDITAKFDSSTVVTLSSSTHNNITICHKPGTPAEKTLVIPEPALNAHLRHGDTLGACP